MVTKNSLWCMVLAASLLLINCNEKKAKQEADTANSEVLNEDISKELSDFKLFMETMAYQPPVIESSNSQSLPPRALVLVKTNDDSVSLQRSNLLVETYLSDSQITDYSFLTLEDLTGSTDELKFNGSHVEGMQSFASGQQASQFALSQDIPALVFISIENFKVREASSIPGIYMANTRAVISLYSTTEGRRLKTSSSQIKSRGTNEDDLIDEVITKLGEGLAKKSDNWSISSSITTP